MSERIAMIFASLSHKWSAIVLIFPVIWIVIAYFAGVHQSNAHKRDDYLGVRSAKAVRVISYAMILCSIPILIISIFHFGCAALKGHSFQCLSNIKQLAMGQLIYSQDYDEHLPSSNRWAAAIAPGGLNAEKYVKHLSSGPFRCPSAESTASYGMNAAMGGISLSETFSENVLLFDADAPIRSFAGDEREVAWKRHSGGANVAFADGHAKSTNASVRDQLIWKPVPTREAHLRKH